MPLGDSITRGTNDVNYPNGDIPGGYRKNLQSRLSTGGFSFDFVGSKSDNAATGMDPHHNGTNGIRTDQVLANLSTWMTVQPDTVLMLLGTNDILQGVPVATAANNLNTLIDRITAGFPQRRLYVSTILPISGKDWNGQSAATLNTNANAYNTQLRSLVQQARNSGRNVTLVDLNAQLVYTNANPANNVFQPGDGVHPGQAGYDQIGSLWFNAITVTGSLLDPPSGTVPSAPGSLTATVVSGSRIDLAWADLSDNETGFKIHRRTGEQGVWEFIGTAGANTTGYAATGLATAGNTYYFAVSATNAAGDSAWSNIAPPLSDNLALNRTASASSIYSSAYSAANANNGSASLIWSAASADTAATWSVDLSATYRIERVEVLTRQDIDQSITRRNFEIRGSNDPSFGVYSVLASQGATPLAHASTFSAIVSNPTGYRYLRVAKTDGGYFTLAEVKVFGTATGSPAPYDSWSASFPPFLALPAADRALSADPNKDGVSNLVAYALGLDPLSNNAAALLPNLALDPGNSSNGIFRFRHNKLATDVAIKVLVSPDLSPGSWTVQSQAAASVTDLGGNVEQISVVIPILSGNACGFVRLEVTQTSP